MSLTAPVLIHFHDTEKSIQDIFQRNYSCVFHKRKKVIEARSNFHFWENYFFKILKWQVHFKKCFKCIIKCMQWCVLFNHIIVNLYNIFTTGTSSCPVLLHYALTHSISWNINKINTTVICIIHPNAQHIKSFYLGSCLKQIEHLWQHGWKWANSKRKSFAVSH